MRPILILTILLFCLACSVAAQGLDTIQAPKVKVTVSLLKNAFKASEDIQLTMILTNETEQTQSIWFDEPKSSTGGPAWTSVTLTDKRTGKTVLKYPNKAVLSSQAYSTQQVKSFSYKLEPNQNIKRQFSLYDMVVTNNENYRLRKGTYELQVIYGVNPSNTITLTVN
jgi:hypothetical protein